ncbi:type I-C CRISPR-associated protein Cas5c [Clostridium sp.]|uniref:type I-C CRISPR-associated protein Cas5c n=1 Tax=Clostridium sp. TaxID=1506 RepID=UPI002612DC4D|nr:type I-C CRISPR-associated protein Cas5c [Clostridium sp.]
MGYGIKLKIWGEYACFSRPEMKVERVSYDVITPSAARGILEAIYWKPAIRWVIDEIKVINPIKFENIKRNELLGVIPLNTVKRAYLGNTDVNLYQSTRDIVQRGAMILKDVCYYISAHFELTYEAGAFDTVEKHYNMALRRARKGQCFHRPYLGCREFPAQFQLADEINEKSFYINSEKDLGLMLWDIDFKNKATPIFFRPSMKDGVIKIPDLQRGDT